MSGRRSMTEAGRNRTALSLKEVTINDCGDGCTFEVRFVVIGIGVVLVRELLLFFFRVPWSTFSSRFKNPFFKEYSGSLYTGTRVVPADVTIRLLMDLRTQLSVLPPLAMADVGRGIRLMMGEDLLTTFSSEMLGGVTVTDGDEAVLLMLVLFLDRTRESKDITDCIARAIPRNRFRFFMLASSASDSSRLIFSTGSVHF